MSMEDAEHLRDLLARYVDHVGECGGSHFLDGSVHDAGTYQGVVCKGTRISTEDAKEIKSIYAYYKESV